MMKLLQGLTLAVVLATVAAAADSQAHGSALLDALKLRQAGKPADAAIALQKLAAEPNLSAGIRARVHNALGLVRRDQGRPDEAAQEFEIALSAAAADEKDCALRPTLTGNMGEARLQQGRYREARALFESALKAVKNCPAQNAVFASLQMLNLAGLARMEGDHKLARKLAEGAHAGLAKELGPKHPHAVLALNNVAQVLAAQGNRKEALRTMEEVRELAREVHGAAHPLYSGALSNLGVAYFVERRFSEAEPLLREALTIDQSVHGAHHPAVVRDLTNLAAVLESTGRPDDAEALLRRAIETSKGNGRADPRAMLSLGTIELGRGRVDDAVRWLHEVSDLVRAGRVAPDPEIARLLERFATALRQIERPAEAERFQSEAIRLRTRALIDIEALRRLDYSELWKGNRQ